MMIYRGDLVKLLRRDPRRDRAWVVWRGMVKRVAASELIECEAPHV